MSQPLIIEKQSVVELSRYTSTDKKSNSEWTNKLVTPLTINENDSILIKQCFLQNKLVDDNSIQIDRDMSVKFQFVYYLIAHGLGQYIVDYSDGQFDISGLTETNFSINGLPYMLVNQSLPSNPYYTETFGKPVVEEFTINLKESIYEKPALADEITRQMQSVNTKTQNQFIPDNNITTCVTITPFYDEVSPTNFVFKNFSVPQSPTNPDKIITVLQKQLYYIDLISYNPSGAEIFPFDGSLFYIDNQNNPIFCKLVPMVDPTQVNYSQTYIDVNKLLVPFTLMEGTNEPTPIGVYSFVYNNVTYTGDVYDCGFIGCSEPALLFNDNQGNQKFSFEIHSPIIQGGNQVVGIFTSTTEPAVPPFTLPNINDTIISYLSAYSGIMFVNIYENYNELIGQEVELLDLLGFSLTDLIPLADIPLVFGYNNDLITDNVTIKKYFQYTNYLQYTTRQFSPLGALSTNFTVNVNKIAQPQQNPPIYTITLPSSIYAIAGNAESTSDSYGYNFSQSDNSTSLLASNFPITSQTNSGHWLVEITGWLSDYVNETKLMMVKAIVGNYLYGNSFSQTLGPDSLIYTHHGVPLSLTQLSIRILNPVTKQLSPNYIIGPNSSIYLQIVNNHTIEEQASTKK
jgi:hypothetical protein